nr:MAG TPA: hypothetical protein [Bacteriophage sp.]
MKFARFFCRYHKNHYLCCAESENRCCTYPCLLLFEVAGIFYFIAFVLLMFYRNNVMVI